MKRSSPKPRAVRATPRVLPPAKVIAAGIGVPLLEWSGNCHAIACKILDAKLLVGVPRYGHYLGPVGQSSPFYGKPLIHHGWIEMPDKVIVDPTRWVFECVAPYLARIAPDMPQYKDYDLGGNRRMGQLGVGVRGMPCPGPDEGFNGQPVERVRLVFKHGNARAARDYLQDLVGTPNNPTKAQLVWVAHRNPDELGEAALALFDAIERVGCKAWIPQDNWDYVVTYGNTEL